jgi:hypothetical protein
VFTLFNYGLVTTQDIYIVGVQEIGEFASGVRETSKFGGTGLIWLFRIGVFTRLNYGLVTLLGCKKVENWPLEF